MDADTNRRGSQARRAGAAVAVGVLVGIVVTTVGAVLLALRPPEFTGRTTLMVIPRDTASSSDFYETLSQGKLVSTYAELLRNALGGTSAPGSTVTTDFQVVPNTSLIRISASGAARSEVEAVTLDLSRRAASTIDDLRQPFEVDVIADPRVERATGPDVRTYAAAIGAIALVAGTTAARLLLRSQSAVIKPHLNGQALPAPVVRSRRREQQPVEASLPAGSG